MTKKHSEKKHDKHHEDKKHDHKHPEKEEKQISELDQVKQERDALKDKALRAMADLENERKRFEREKADTAKYAISNFARDLLTVLDNMALALQSVKEEDCKENELLNTLCQGVSMTQSELLKAFEKHNIKKVDPMGEKFDHNFHQAMMEIEDDSKEPGTVVQVMQPGYVINDRLLRPALVGVSKKK